MADNQALANALQQMAAALQQQTAVLQTLQTNNANAQNAPQAAPLLDPLASVDPLDLAPRAGSHAFETMSSALDETWDGTPETFPARQ